MININPVRVAINVYGVIGKRVATAVLAQKDMRLAGVADIATDWRLRVLEGQGIDLYAVTSEHAKAMREAGIPLPALWTIFLDRPTSSSIAHPSVSPRRMQRSIAQAASSSSFMVAKSMPSQEIPSLRKSRSTARWDERRRGWCPATRPRSYAL